MKIAISKKRLVEIIKEELLNDYEKPTTAYLAEGGTLGHYEGEARDKPSEEQYTYPNLRHVRDDTPTFEDDPEYIMYRGMKYHIPEDPEAKQMFEDFIDEFFDRE